jgi:hypothetical protein
METTKEEIDKYINGANVTRITQVKIRVKKEREHREKEKEKDEHYNLT